MSIENPIRVSDLEMGSGVVPQVEEDSLIAIGQRSRAAVAAEDAEGAEATEMAEGEEVSEVSTGSADDASDDAGEDS